MISFNQHVLVRGGDAEDTWLNEGLSHFAEELGGAAGPRRALRRLTTACTQFGIGDFSNAYDYLASPEDELPDRAGHSTVAADGVRGAPGSSCAGWPTTSPAPSPGTDLTRKLVQTSRPVPPTSRPRPGRNSPRWSPSGSWPTTSTICRVHAAERPAHATPAGPSAPSGPRSTRRTPACSTAVSARPRQHPGGYGPAGNLLRRLGPARADRAGAERPGASISSSPGATARRCCRPARRRSNRAAADPVRAHGLLRRRRHLFAGYGTAYLASDDVRYLTRAGIEETRILQSRQPIARLAADRATDPGVRAARSAWWWRAGTMPPGSGWRPRRPTPPTPTWGGTPCCWSSRRRPRTASAPTPGSTRSWADSVQGILRLRGGPPGGRPLGRAGLRHLPAALVGASPPWAGSTTRCSPPRSPAIRSSWPPPCSTRSPTTRST